MLQKVYSYLPSECDLRYVSSKSRSRLFASWCHRSFSKSFALLIWARRYDWL